MDTLRFAPWDIALGVPVLYSKVLTMRLGFRNNVWARPARTGLWGVCHES